MLQKIKYFISNLSDNTKATLVIWWFAGALYFFVGWGTNLGKGSTPFDLIFFLGIGMGIITIFFVNPIIYGMFTIEQKGKIANKKYYDRSILEGSVSKILEVFKAIFITILVYLSYQIINQLIIIIFNLEPEKVSLPGDPLIYATFYALYFQLIEGIKNKIKLLVRSKK